MEEDKVIRFVKNTFKEFLVGFVVVISILTFIEIGYIATKIGGSSSFLILNFKITIMFISVFIGFSFLLFLMPFVKKWADKENSRRKKLWTDLITTIIRTENKNKKR